MDTAAFYFAVSAISRRFHRPRMIDRNNYTRDTIHVPNNGIAVVCHGEKRKKKKEKKNTYPLQNKYACARSFSLSRSRTLTKNLFFLNSAIRHTSDDEPPRFLRTLSSFALSKQSASPDCKTCYFRSGLPPNRKIRAFYDPRNLVYHGTAPSAIYDAVTCRFAARSPPL